MFKKIIVKKDEKKIDHKNILVAALLIHAAKIDDNYTTVEKEIIKKALISLFGIHPNETEELFKKAESHNKELKNFLLMEGIENIWKNLQSSSPSENHFTKQFHRWFDGFKTIRFLKHFT